MDGNPERKVLGACQWCGKDAYQRLVLRAGGKTTKGYRNDATALVCVWHFRQFHSQDEIGIHVEGNDW